MIEGKPAHFPEPTEGIKATQEKRERVYTILTDPEQRREIARLMENFVDEIKNKDIKNIVFLDKSARPLVTAFQAIWQRKYGTEPQEKPHISFLNIGTESFSDWGAEEILDHVNTREMEPELQRVADEYKYLQEAASESEVVIFEELTDRGHSLAIAKKFLESAFPELRFSTFSLTKTPDTPFIRNEGYGPPWGTGGEYGTDNMTGVVDAAKVDSTVIAVPRRQLFENISKEMRDEKLHGNRQHELNRKASAFMKGIDDILRLRSLRLLISRGHKEVVVSASMGSWHKFRNEAELAKIFEEAIAPNLKPFLDNIEETLRQINILYREELYNERGYYREDKSDREFLLVDHNEILQALNQEIVRLQVYIYRQFDSLVDKYYPESNEPNEQQQEVGPMRGELYTYLRNLLGVVQGTLYPIMSPLQELIKDQPHTYKTAEDYKKIFDEKGKRVNQLRQELHSAIEEYWQAREG